VSHKKIKPTAVQRAERVVELALKSNGHRAEIRVIEHEAEYHSSGTLLLPARRVVHVAVFANSWFDRSGGATWSELMPGQGRSTISRFVGGYGGTHEGSRNFRSEKDFWSWLRVYVHYE
jgi:hypothetical protein